MNRIFSILYSYSIHNIFSYSHRLSNPAHKIDGDERVNWSDDNWDDLWDNPTDQ